MAAAALDRSLALNQNAAHAWLIRVNIHALRNQPEAAIEAKSALTRRYAGDRRMRRIAPEPPLDRWLGEWASHAFPAVKGSRLKRVQNKVGTF